MCARSAKSFPCSAERKLRFKPSNRLRDLLGRRPDGDKAPELRPVWTRQQADGGCRGEPALGGQKRQKRSFGSRLSVSGVAIVGRRGGR